MPVEEVPVAGAVVDPNLVFAKDGLRREAVAPVIWHLPELCFSTRSGADQWRAGTDSMPPTRIGHVDDRSAMVMQMWLGPLAGLSGRNACFSINISVLVVIAPHAGLSGG